MPDETYRSWFVKVDRGTITLCPGEHAFGEKERP